MANETVFKIRSDTAENWLDFPFLLMDRELVYDTTAHRLKMGDGKNKWANLDYITPAVINDYTSTSVTDALSANKGRELYSLLGTKADTTALTNLNTTLTNLINQRATKTEVDNLEIKLINLINQKTSVVVENTLTSSNTANALSANQGRILKGFIDGKADSSALTNLETKLTSFINNISSVEVVDDLSHNQDADSEKALSARMGALLWAYLNDTRTRLNSIESGSGGGTPPTVIVGTTTTGEPGTKAQVTNVGTKTDAILNFTIPKGATGAAGTAATIEIRSVKSGTTAKVTNVGTSTNAILDFVLPKGDKGEQGAQGLQGPKGADGVSPTVVNSLTDTSTTKALSAYQGYLLNNKINNITTKVNNVNTLSVESWTFTLTSGGTVTKKVVLSS